MEGAEQSVTKVSHLAGGEWQAKELEASSIRIDIEHKAFEGKE